MLAQQEGDGIDSPDTEQCCSCVATTESAVLLSLTGVPNVASRSRAIIGRHLREGGADDDELYTTALIATELISNALRHAPPALCVRVDADEDRIRVEVHDSDRTGPTLPHTLSLDSSGSRGLWLVDALSAEWGHRQHEVGKVVWADVPRTGHPGGRAAHGPGE